MRFPTMWYVQPQRLRPAWAYAQSDQSLCQSLEYSTSVKLLTEHYFVLSLHLSKCHIVGNLMSRLIYQQYLSTLKKGVGERIVSGDNPISISMTVTCVCDLKILTKSLTWGKTIRFNNLFLHKVRYAI